MKTYILVFFSIIFTGCASNYNEIGKNITDSVKTAFLTEETLKVGVKKAYITESTDAKSKIVTSVKLNEQIKVIGLKDNDSWFKVLTPKKEGFIPRSAMIEITVLDSLGKMLGMAWQSVKNKNDKRKTTFNAKSKDWTDETRRERLKKSWTKNKKEDYLTGKKPKYTEKYMDKYFVNLSSRTSDKSVNYFRAVGGLK